MSGRYSRNKGQLGEREFAKFLNEMLNCNAHRGRQYKGGNDSPDIITDPMGLHFEVKRTEYLSIYKAMQQAINDAGSNIPCVAHRKSRGEWLLVIRGKDLVKLSRRIMKQRRKNGCVTNTKTVNTSDTKR